MPKQSQKAMQQTANFTQTNNTQSLAGGNVVMQTADFLIASLFG